jgi:hypothetical protein
MRASTPLYLKTVPTKALLALAVAFPITSPALAWAKCPTPPGSPDGTAQWSDEGKEIEAHLTTSGGNRYACGPDIRQNNSPERPGSRMYFKRTCGPLTVVAEVTYRNCTYKERTGIGYGDDASSRLIGAYWSQFCAMQKNVTSSTRYELRDKAGQVFQLGKTYGLGLLDRGPGNSCTRN